MTTVESIEPVDSEESWYLGVSYCLEEHEWGVLDEQLEEVVGTMCNGTGTCFGYRDMDWDFPTKKDAEEARDRLMLAGLEVEIHEVCELGV